jgi:cytosine/adenosine deaminase-related metal-dependent hydrolase
VFFHELVGSREDRTGDALRDAEDERRAYVASQPWPAGVDYVPAPHAAYSVGPDLLRRIFAAAARQGHPTSVHVAEDADEIALLRDGGGGWPPVLDAMGVPRGSRSPGLSPVAYLDELGAFAGPTPPLLVHMVHASDEDRALAARRGATAVLCPRSNLHVGGRLPDVPVLLAAEVAIALGTDSLASSPSLSLWGELATLAASFPTVDPLVWLRAATAGGARALALADLGALAPAKRPGIIDVSPDATSTAANSDLQADAATMARALVRSTAPRVRWLAHATRQPAAGPTGAAGAAT